MTSIIFIVEAVALGMLLKYGKLNKWVNTAIAIALLIFAVVVGLSARFIYQEKYGTSLFLLTY